MGKGTEVHVDVVSMRHGEDGGRRVHRARILITSVVTHRRPTGRQEQVSRAVMIPFLSACV